MWIVDAVIVQITYYTGGNINVTPGTESFLSDRDIAILTLGSKWEYASFYSYSGLICMFPAPTLPRFSKYSNLPTVRLAHL